METYERTVTRNPFLPHPPHPKQQQFLLHADTLEVLYGGAAGGGKTDALLMAALQFVETPGYAALLLRRSFRDLNQPDALIPRSKEWLTGKAHWSTHDKRWTFPSGATLTFGYLDHADDIYQFQGAAFQFVGFDEVTQFDEGPYRYLFSRLRRLEGADLPLRMRAASNPGGRGHDWVKSRFLSPDAGRVFIPARLHDNPSLDADSYVRSLSQLDPVTRAQLLAGDWDAVEGGRFRREWFQRTFAFDGKLYHLKKGSSADAVPVGLCSNFVTVDPAASEKHTADYTAIIVFTVTPAKDLLIREVVRKRLNVDRIVPEIAEVCGRWQPQWVGIEANGFSWAVTHQAQRTPGIPAVRPLEPQGKGKLVRATPAIIRCEAGQVFLPEQAPWKEDFVAECVRFTGDETQDSHDDQVDAFAYAAQWVDSYPTFGPVEFLQVDPPRSAADRFYRSDPNRARGDDGLGRRHMFGR